MNEIPKSFKPYKIKHRGHIIKSFKTESARDSHYKKTNYMFEPEYTKDYNITADDMGL